MGIASGEAFCAMRGRVFLAVLVVVICRQRDEEMGGSGEA